MFLLPNFHTRPQNPTFAWRKKQKKRKALVGIGKVKIHETKQKNLTLKQKEFSFKIFIMYSAHEKQVKRRIYDEHSLCTSFHIYYNKVNFSRCFLRNL